VRPWPWILVGLASLVLYPHLGPDEKRLGYVYAMRDFLPDGLRGMLVASFFAAFMSTVATQLNWGTSYLINDFYKRFVHPEADEKQLVRASRFTTLGLMVLSLLVTVFMETISGAWSFVLEAGAGLGLVLILRWFWWRVNAWSEITAMVVPFLAYAFVKYRLDIQFPETLFFIAGITSLSWIAVTFLTSPVDVNHLKAFYRRVHPGGVGWKPIARQMPEVKGDTHYRVLFLNWIVGVLFIYMTLFGVGKIILRDYLVGAVCLLAGCALAYLIYRNLSRHGFETIVE
jgi:SSS family solute:Na+ symporter